jgi:MFS family permease
MDQAQAAAREWKDHWPIVFAATMGMTFSPIPTASMGFFIDPLHSEFAWTVAAITSGLTIQSLASGFLVPFVGALADRFGARAVALPSIFMAAISFAAFGLVTGSLWQWTAIWVVYSIVSLGTRSAVWSTAISKTFVLRRGTALAICLAGLAVTQAVAPIAARWLIDSYGWRTGYFGLGLGWGGFVALIVLFLFHDRRRATPSHTQGETPHRPPQGGLTLLQALSNHRVLRIALAVLLTSIAGGAVNVHLVKILGIHGIARADAALVASVFGIATIGGKLIAGWLMDRFSTTFIPVLSFSLPALAYLLLAQDTTLLWTAFLAAVLSGLGGGASLECATYLTSRYAGTLHFGKIFGIIASMMGFAGGLGPLFAGAVYDRTGSYAALLSTCVGLVLVAGLAVLRLGPYPHFVPAEENRA